MKYQRIQDLRIDSDLSQKQLGEVLHISQRSYSHYETGSRGIPVEMLIRLADYYDTTIDYLVGRTNQNLFLTEISYNEQEKELVYCFKKLPLYKREKALAYIQGLLDA